jgi:hypothetical protein
MPAMPLNLTAFLSKGWCFNPQIGKAAQPLTKKQYLSPLEPGREAIPHQR